MQVGVELVALLLVLGVVYLAWTVSASVMGRSQRSLQPAAKWRADHYSRDDSTYVVVRRHPPGPGTEDGTLTVAVVHNADPDWEEKFHEAGLHAPAGLG